MVHTKATAKLAKIAINYSHWNIILKKCIYKQNSAIRLSYNFGEGENTNELGYDSL